MLDSADTAGVGHADHQGHRQDATSAVAQLGDVRHDLFEGRVGECIELHLDHGPKAPHRHPDRKSDDSGLRQRGIETAVGAERLGKAVGDAKDASQRADVLAEHHHGIVIFERIA